MIYQIRDLIRHLRDNTIQRKPLLAQCSKTTPSHSSKSKCEKQRGVNNSIEAFPPSTHSPLSDHSDKSSFSLHQIRVHSAVKTSRRAFFLCHCPGRLSEKISPKSNFLMEKSHTDFRRWNCREWRPKTRPLPAGELRNFCNL